MDNNQQVTDNFGTEGPTGRETNKPTRRLQLLGSGAKALCVMHQTLHLVTDAFKLAGGLILKLECECQRPLGLNGCLKAEGSL